MINVSRRTAIRVILASLAAGIALPYLLIANYYRTRNKSGKDSGMRGTEVRKGRVMLPLPRLRGDVSLEEAMANRRSLRDYLDEPLTIEELSQILWAAYGISETRWGFKTTPSAGATYPLVIYAVLSPGGVVVTKEPLAPGSYKYDPYTHSLTLVREGDLVDELYEAGLRQSWIKDAPVNLVFTAIYERTTDYYGSRGVRYVHMEIGHAGQNVYLQATALGLGTVAIGAFHDERVAKIIGADPSERPLYIMPVGRPVKPYKLEQAELAKYILSRRG